MANALFRYNNSQSYVRAVTDYAEVMRADPASFRGYYQWQVYYALATGSIAAEAAPGRLRRNMPDPLPVIVLGRLAVHGQWSGRGIGSGLLKDAVLRSIQAAELVGVRALLCHAIDEEARAFYLKRGFAESPLEARTLLVGLR